MISTKKEAVKMENQLWGHPSGLSENSTLQNHCLITCFLVLGYPPFLDLFTILGGQPFGSCSTFGGDSSRDSIPKPMNHTSDERRYLGVGIGQTCSEKMMTFAAWLIGFGH